MGPVIMNIHCKRHTAVTQVPGETHEPLVNVLKGVAILVNLFRKLMISPKLIGHALTTRHN